jgi:hypothetical protein
MPHEHANPRASWGNQCSVVRAAACLLVTGLLLSQCAHRNVAPPGSVEVEWDAAAHAPLTYCPKGHRLPAAGSASAQGAEFIYLMDRKTRYFIPPGCADHRRQALALREASKDARTRAEERALMVARPFVVLGGFYLLMIPDMLGLTSWSDIQTGRRKVAAEP